MLLPQIIEIIICDIIVYINVFNIDKTLNFYPLASSICMYTFGIHSKEKNITRFVLYYNIYRKLISSCHEIQ